MAFPLTGILSGYLSLILPASACRLSAAHQHVQFGKAIREASVQPETWLPQEKEARQEVRGIQPKA